MNKIIIKKCLDKLAQKASKENIAYVIGMLEVLYETPDTEDFSHIAFNTLKHNTNDAVHISKEVVTDTTKLPDDIVGAVNPDAKPIIRKQIIPKSFLSMMTPHDTPGASEERRVA